MSIQQPSISGSSTPPWQQKQLSYGLKLLIMFGAALLFVILIVTLFTTIGSLSSVVGGRAARGNPNSSLVALLVSVVLFVVSLFGLIKLFPYLSAPANFKPSYGAVAADVRGHPFEIRYQRGGWGRSMSGKGTARFDKGGLSIEGYLTPSPLFQVGVIVVVTVIPLIVLGIGLGLIPALLIAYYAGRKRITQAIPYMDLRNLNLKGCKVTFEHPGALPGNVAFYTSVSDGERLYRELQERFPALVVGTLQ